VSTASGSLLRVCVWAAAFLGVLFVILQFFRPALTNPPVIADLAAPPEVQQILRNSCYNCHSNETLLPWFDRIVPAYWIAARDVRLGRLHLNFSEIGNLPAAQQKAALYESVSQIELGAMPLPAYKRVHPESAITSQQLAVLKTYLTPSLAHPPATPADVAAADAQYNKWIQPAGVASAVSPAPNGIPFLPGYKDWKAISSTERFDNHTMRQILGNDVAIKAIAENHINPWPDGTVFAKVAWYQQTDDNGLVRPGAFFQVEFMLRDSQKYAPTLGWGWARWRGADLKPYGKDASFTNECVGCHKPLSKTNYVFTLPIRGQL
jgi:Haem-binding domain/Cytochrome P460